MNKYRAYLEEHNLLPNTIDAYCYDLKRLISYLSLIELELVDVSPKIVTKYISDLGGSGTRKKRCLASISSYFNYLVETEIISINPVAGIRRPRVKLLDPNWLQVYEVERVRETCPDIFKVIVDTFYLTGIRLEELRTCRLGTLDLQGKQLKVIGKGEKPRYVPFPQSLANLFETYLETRNPSPSFENYLFLTERGKPYTRNQLEYIMVKLSKISGITVRPHILRHSFATHAIEKGMSRQSVQKVLGHVSVSTTDWYVHIEPNVRSEYDTAFPR